MELDRALELAVAASWEDIVKPGDVCSVHVEYEKQPDSPLASLSVWKIKNRGYGTLVCRYDVAPPNSASSAPELSRAHFANSYQSKILANCLDFIMTNQGQFTRPADRSIHGMVQIECPSKEARSEAAAWHQPACTELAETVWN